MKEGGGSLDCGVEKLAVVCDGGEEEGGCLVDHGCERRCGLDCCIKGTGESDIGHNCDVDLGSVIWEVLENEISLLLTSNYAADRVASFDELGDDVKTKEAISSCEENSRRGHVEWNRLKNCLRLVFKK